MLESSTTVISPYPLARRRQVRTGMYVSCGVRVHAQLPAVDLKSTPLTTRAN